MREKRAVTLRVYAAERGLDLLEGGRHVERVGMQKPLVVMDEGDMACPEEEVARTLRRGVGQRLSECLHLLVAVTGAGDSADHQRCLHAGMKPSGVSRNLPSSAVAWMRLPKLSHIRSGDFRSGAE